jgi:nucleotide-binding universal stress UspA family protein
MLPIRTILHPTDFSDRSAYAYHLACALARDYGARLIVLSVYRPPATVYAEMGPLVAEPLDSMEEITEKLTRLKPEDLEGRVDHYVREGDPAAEIVRLAREAHCDLIVMGTHGRRGLSRLLMGSVAEAVLRKAPCPVLTVKTPLEEVPEVPAEKHEPASV